jgi:hypothetical protein
MAAPMTPGSAFPVAVPRPTDGILAPVLRTKNSAILDYIWFSVTTCGGLKNEADEDKLQEQSR